VLKVHNLTPESFHRNNYFTNANSTMFSDYCQISGISFSFDEDSYLCEVELPRDQRDFDEGSNILDLIDWNLLVKHTSKKLVITHRIIYNLSEYLEKLNELVLKYNLSERVFWFTFNPLDFNLKKKCKFKLLFLDSLTNVFYENRYHNIFFLNKINQNPNDFFKFKYGFEPADSNFIKLSFDKCDKYFMSSSATTKAHRLLATYLIKKLIGLDKGVVTFHGIEDEILSVEDYLSSYSKQLMKYNIDIDEVLNFKSFRGDNFDEISDSFFEHSLQHSFLNVYETCLINYVNESTSNENEIFLTEKTWINYAHGKPFIMNGNKNTLLWLEKYYGFKSFSAIFNESYDSKNSLVDRTYYGIQELSKFCSLSFSEAVQKVKEVQKILDHNYNVFFSLNHKERFLKIFNEI